MSGIKSFFKNKVANNALWFIFGKAAQSILAFLVGIFTARYLGPSNYGIINYAASIVAFVVPIMNLGFNNVLVQELTVHPEEEGEIIGSSVLLSIFSSLACIVGVSSYTFIVDAGEKTTNVVVIMYSIMLVFQAFELIQYWFQAKLLSKQISIVSFFAYLFVSVYKIVLLINNASVFWFAISNSIDYCLIAIALLVIYKKMGGQRLSFSKTTAKRLFAGSKHYILSSLMVTIFAQTDKIMLKLMISEESVGFYSAAATCSGVTAFIFVAIIDSFRPIIFQYKKDGNIVLYEKTIARLYCIIIYLALLQSIFITIFARFLINLIYGKAYLSAVSASQIIVWYSTFSYMGAVRNIWILGENKQKFLWILNLGGAVLNIVLNLCFIPLWGINGAALASLITQAFTNIVMNVIVWPLRHNNKLILQGLNPALVFEFFKRKN